MQELITTAAETGRDPNATESDETTEAESSIPTEIWIKQYQNQATPKLIAGLNRSETMSQIRALATSDKPVLRVLDAYDAGCETKDEVLAHARMKSRTYHNAYGRLRRIVRYLTDHKLAPKARA